MQHLDKQRALEMISQVIDGEVTPEKRLAFMAFIRKDKEIKEEYESQKKIKLMIRERCKKVKAPDHLRKRIIKILNEEDQETLN